LGVEPREFVRGLMSYYDPVTYDIVFGRESRPDGSATRAIRPARASSERRSATRNRRMLDD
jgi:hypothetical protein